MKKVISVLLISFYFISCEKEISYPVGNYFSLSETQVSFNSNSGEQSIEISNPQGTTSAVVISENSDWCTVSISNDKVIVKVDENILFQSRKAKVAITSGKEKIEILVLQSRKNFENIAPVLNLEAISGPGQITLKWAEPVEDNFSFVVLSYMLNDEQYRIVMKNGETEHTFKGLLSENGEHTFYVQSFDKENDPGDIAKITAIPGKLVAFRFEKEAGTQWVPYYLRTSDLQSVLLKVGSLEYNMNEETAIIFEIDENLLDSYVQESGRSVKLLPASTYSLPDDFVHIGATAYQEMNIEIDISSLEDNSLYGLPIRIKSAEPALVSEIMSSMVVVFYVDDLEGWYTVDRLSKSGEGVGSYPEDPVKRRRYIKRTGETTWETGYLFRSYVNNEGHTSSGTNVQYISIDPATKQIFIQQGSYAVTENYNVYDFSTQELKIEYLYRDWAGWWTHERMYNRSLTK